MVSLKTVTYETALPCNLLHGFVSHFWCSYWHHGVQNYFRYYSTANTNAELAFAFSPKNTSRCHNVFASFLGHTENHACIETGGFSEMFGVSVHAHAIPFFFGVPALQLSDQLLDMKELLHRDAAVLIDQLARGTGFADRVKIMSQYLLSRMNTASNQDLLMLNAIKRIREMKGNVDIRSLANEFSLSQKQFERRFKEFSSFNPKLYSRIIRFESSLSASPRYNSYTGLALEHGYYDQAHFINEFRKFSGFSPRKYCSLTSY